jgi:hypothetical protein
MEMLKAAESKNKKINCQMIFFGMGRETSYLQLEEDSIVVDCCRLNPGRVRIT